MGKIKGFILNRKQYNRIRKMDHCQMTLWAESVYKSGFKDGQEATPGLSSQEIRHALLPIKGIGEKKIDVIVKALEDELQAKSDALDMRMIGKRQADLPLPAGKPHSEKWMPSPPLSKKLWSRK